MFRVRNQLKYNMLWDHRFVKVPTSDWPLEQIYVDLRELFIWKRAHGQSVNGLCTLWMLAVFGNGLCVWYVVIVKESEKAQFEHTVDSEKPLHLVGLC